MNNLTSFSDGIAYSKSLESLSWLESLMQRSGQGLRCEVPRVTEANEKFEETPKQLDAMEFRVAYEQERLREEQNPALPPWLTNLETALDPKPMWELVFDVIKEKAITDALRAWYVRIQLDQKARDQLEMEKASALRVCSPESDSSTRTDSIEHNLLPRVVPPENSSRR